MMDYAFVILVIFLEIFSLVFFSMLTKIFMKSKYFKPIMRTIVELFILEIFSLVFSDE